MKQYEAVILSLEKLGGQATLGQLNSEVMKIKDCEWKTKTPFASIRRIVQVRPEIVKIRPGLYALKSKLNTIDDFSDNDHKNEKESNRNHAYYQGIITEIGNMRKFDTFIPNQERNHKYVNTTLGSIRSIDQLPKFSYEALLQKSSSIDVIWFNERKMPHSFFEVEHTTDIQNSLLKFNELQDFYCNMIIVADGLRKPELDKKLNYIAFKDIHHRVKFLPYDTLLKQYESEIFKSSTNFVL